MKKIFAMALLVVSSLLNANQYYLSGKEVFLSQELSDVTVSIDNGKFFVNDNAGSHEIQRCFLSKDIREMGAENFLKFLNNDGYVSVNKMSDGEYSLRAHGRVRGGGPISGAIAYWVTKSACYGTAAAGATTAVVATGGVAGALTNMALAATTLNVGAGVTLTAAGITGAGAAKGAALATAGVVSSAGGIAGAVAAVETASLGACAFFTALPFLP